jgi:hypothetical protein
VAGLSRGIAWRALGVAVLVALIVVPGGRVRGEVSPQTAVTDSPFGLIEPHDAPQYADRLGAAWGRARFHWARIQPDGPDQWIEADLTEAELSGELDAGREVVGLLIGVPGWAQDARGLPAGLDLPPDDPGNLWAAFVREAVGRYAGRIDHWIVWNEPDVWDPAHPAYTWPGDVDDYAQLLRVAYLVAKETNPDAVIHLAAVSHWWDVQAGRDLYFPALLDAVVAAPGAAENAYYYDVATLHLYFNPASVYDVLVEYAGYQSERGLDKPFWLVETNAAPSDDPAWPVAEVTFHVSLLEQAAYMPQALSLALAAGAERIAVFKLLDTPGDHLANPEPFGLVRADGSPRPVFQTTQTAFDLLSDVDRVEWNERGEVAQVVAVGQGEVIRVLWSRLPRAFVAEVPALADRATLVDMWGNRSTVEAVDGAYRLTLYAGECQQTVGDYCMIGGPPVYLIDRVVLPPGDALPALRGVEAATDEKTGWVARPLVWPLAAAGISTIVAAVAALVIGFRLVAAIRQLIPRLRGANDGDR